MDKLLESADQEVSLAVAAAEEQFDKRLFQQFIQKKKQKKPKKSNLGFSFFK